MKVNVKSNSDQMVMFREGFHRKVSESSNSGSLRFVSKQGIFHMLLLLKTKGFKVVLDDSFGLLCFY